MANRPVSNKSDASSLPRPVRAPEKLPRNNIRILVLCAGLVALTFLVFGTTCSFSFVNLDDRETVSENPSVTSGLASSNIISAFSTSTLGNWVPVTTLSHMADCQLFQLDAGWHHFTNVLIHSFAAILLLLALYQMTGALWRSALVSGIFAVHPLRVESVAWVSERKDVLCGFFFLLTILMYLKYVRRPGRSSYIWVAICFALALMSKPMAITLPAVLLLLDWWPLNRFTASKSGQTSPVARRLVVEKIPLLVLAGLATVAAFIAQNQAQAVQPLGRVSLGFRAANALVSYAAYLKAMFWPADLAAYYPLPMGGWPAGQIVFCALLLVLITTAAVVLRRSHPFLFVGWLWYLIMLVPVIGLVQVGGQARADRYTYLPQIGVYVAIVWLVGRVAERKRVLQFALGTAGIVIVAALGLAARAQTACWRSSEQLWRHTLACTTDNAFAQYNYGTALAEHGNLDGALPHFQRAVEIQPDYADARNNLGYIQMERHDFQAALTNLQQAVSLKPGFAGAHNNYGRLCAALGDLRTSEKEYQTALQLDPKLVSAIVNYGYLLSNEGRTNEAVTQYQKAVALNPQDATAQNNLGDLLMRQGHLDEAVGHLIGALEANPDSQAAQDNLNQIAWVLATAPEAAQRNGQKAVAIGKQLVRLSDGNNPAYLATLAAALAETGQFDEAVSNVAAAHRIAVQEGDQVNGPLLAAQLELYHSHHPYRTATNQPAAH